MGLFSRKPKQKLTADEVFARAVAGVADDPQAALNDALGKMRDALAILHGPRPLPPVQVPLELLSAAHVDFGLLVAAGWNVDTTRPLAVACKQMVDGLVNGDAESLSLGIDGAAAGVRRLEAEGYPVADEPPPPGNAG
jgi:hypothetical protein